MTYSSCLHDQQDLGWGNTSRDTSEESQESQATFYSSPQCLVDQIQVQKPIPAVATDQMPDHT